MIKKIWNSFLDIVKDVLEQSWTLLGLFIAWLVLEGSARDVVGVLIWITISVWIVTHKFRKF